VIDRSCSANCSLMMFVASCRISAFVTGSTVRFDTLMPSAVSVRSLTESGFLGRILEHLNGRFKL
jgi:hypothetical protein